MKAGWKTTEFWVSTLTIVGLVVSSAAASLPDKYAAIGASVAAAVYAISRGLAKLNTPVVPTVTAADVPAVPGA